MKKVLLLIITFMNLFCTTNADQMTPIDEIIQSIKQTAAPDARTRIFAITYSMRGQDIILLGETTEYEAKTELIKQVSAVTSAQVVDSIRLLPAAELGSKKFGVVRLSVANIRSKPEHSAELATQALLGTPVKVLDKKGGWYRIQTPDEYISWVDDDGIELMDAEMVQSWNEKKKLIITKTYTHCYESKSSEGRIVSDLTSGCIMALVGEDGDYFLVSYPDGRAGYVLKSESAPFDEYMSRVELHGESILSIAYRFMGVPYLWGGTSPKGLDCSGFTKTVYFLHGMILQRDASQQVYTGIPVDISSGFEKLEKGDLLYFGSINKTTGKERITHTAIYIGESDFIHAAGSVRINSLDPSKPHYSEYRRSTLMYARRFLGATEREGVGFISKSRYYHTLGNEK